MLVEKIGLFFALGVGFFFIWIYFSLILSYILSYTIEIFLNPLKFYAYNDTPNPAINKKLFTFLFIIGAHVFLTSYFSEDYFNYWTGQFPSAFIAKNIFLKKAALTGSALMSPSQLSILIAAVYIFAALIYPLMFSRINSKKLIFGELFSRSNLIWEYHLGVSLFWSFSILGFLNINNISKVNVFTAGFLIFVNAICAYKHCKSISIQTKSQVAQPTPVSQGTNHPITKIYKPNITHKKPSYPHLTARNRIPKKKYFKKKLDYQEFKSKDPFYNCIQWKNLRQIVIKAYGRTCMRCKSNTKHPHVDHIRPKSKYPHLALTFENLQILCAECNYGKSNRNNNDYRPKHKIEGAMSLYRILKVDFPH